MLVALRLLGRAVPAERAQLPGYNGHHQSEHVWSRMDNCKRQAWKQHPDYTRESNAKRDEVVKHCLEANNAPPLSPFDPGRPARTLGLLALAAAPGLRPSRSWPPLAVTDFVHLSRSQPLSSEQRRHLRRRAPALQGSAGAA